MRSKIRLVKTILCQQMAKSFISDTCDKDENLPALKSGSTGNVLLA